MNTSNRRSRRFLAPLAIWALLAMACSQNDAAPNESCLDAGTAGSMGASGSGGAVAGAAGSSAGTTGGAGSMGGAGSASGGVTGAAGSAAAGAGGAGSGGAGRDGGTDSDTSDAGTPSCAPKPGGNLCMSIPRFTGTQVVDGIGDEFCNVPATIHAFKNGVTLNGSKPPPLPDVLVARVGWDDVGIHAHFHVDDSEILGQDGIQFDIGGQFPLAGFFDGVSQDVGLINIGLGVKQTGTVLGFPITIPASAGMSFQGNQTQCVPSPCDHTPTGLVSFGQPLVAPAEWAYRDVAGGYEWELLLPWSILGRSSPPVAGMAVAADLALNDQSSRLFAQSFLALTPLPKGAGSQCTTAQAPNPDPTKLGTVTNVDPSCDDRSWCSPTLE